MLELWDIVGIIGLFFLFLLLFIGILARVIRRIIPQMVPELMKSAAGNLPNISMKQGIGLFMLEFINQGGMQVIIQKLMGALGGPIPPPQGALPPQQWPILPRGGQ